MQLLASLIWLISFISPSAFSSDPRSPFPSELSYSSIVFDSPQRLPSLLDEDSSQDGSVQLSVIVPAYNEATRLPIMLGEALDYLEKHYRSYEVLIVDDGSKDSTSQVALEFAKKRKNTGGENIRVVVLKQNRGKGGAVRHGMLHARGKRLLFVDADGASKFEDLGLLEKEMDSIVGKSGRAENGVSNGHSKTSSEGRAIVLGSRAHMVRTEAVVKASPLLHLTARSKLTSLAAIQTAESLDAILPSLSLRPRYTPYSRHPMRLQALYPFSSASYLP